MSFFETMLALLVVAILLLQVSRRIGLPYPAMLAAAGVGVALIPGVPSIRIDPHMALALFVAPALVDAAFDFPLGAMRKLWRPLFALAVVAVLLTTATVAWLGWAFAGLPIAAAVALGAIVAPPDAAAANAVLGSVSMPRRAIAVLKGESLLNDATALLLFSTAVAIQQQGGGLDGGTALQLGLAVPGGVLLGLVAAWLYRRVHRFVSGSLGGHLLEFANTFLLWIIAERLHLSAVLCVVAFAMAVARSPDVRPRPRVRVHSYAVWETAVFLLNVLAFLLMGMQAKMIVGGMAPARLEQAAWFAGAVVAAVVVVRIGWVLAYNRLAARFVALRGDFKPATLRQGLLVGWSGMRGLLTMATAFALPADFPQRDLIVLTAFAVVLATLVVQGLTLAPLIRLLGLGGNESYERELAATKATLAATALDTLSGEDGAQADALRQEYESARRAAEDPAAAAPLKRHRALALAAICAERDRLQALSDGHEIGPDVFQTLEEHLDWKELAILADEDDGIEEN